MNKLLSSYIFIYVCIFTSEDKGNDACIIKAECIHKLQEGLQQETLILYFILSAELFGRLNQC